MERKYIYGIIIVCVFVLLILYYLYRKYNHPIQNSILSLNKKQNNVSTSHILSISNNKIKNKKSVHFNLNKTEGLVFERNDPPAKLRRNSYKYGKYVAGEIPYRKHKVIKNTRRMTLMT